MCFQTKAGTFVGKTVSSWGKKPVFAYSLVSLFQTMLNVGPIKNVNKLIGILKLRKTKKFLKTSYILMF